jgi:hypothetical protein
MRFTIIVCRERFFKEIPYKKFFGNLTIKSAKANRVKAFFLSPYHEYKKGMT